MKIKASQILNKAVYAKHSQKYLEKVDGLVINPNTKQVQAVVLRESRLFADYVVDFRLVRDIGESEIWIDSEVDLKRASEFLESEDVSVFSYKYGYMPVLSESNYHLGYLYDWYIDTEQAKLTDLEVLAGRTTEDRWKVPADQILGFSSNALFLKSKISAKLYRETVGKRKAVTSTRRKARFYYRQRGFTTSKNGWLNDISKALQSKWRNL